MLYSLGNLLQAAHGQSRDFLDLQAQISQRGYIKDGCYADEFQKWMALPRQEFVNRARNQVFSIPTYKRNPALQLFIDTQVVPLPQANLSVCTENDARNCLLERFAGAIATGARIEDDIALSAKVAAGTLRAQPAVNTIVWSLINMVEKSERGMRRLTTGAIEADQLAEVGFFPWGHQPVA